MKNKRRISYHRRDSRLGMLIGKSSHIKSSDQNIPERRYNSQLTSDNRLFSKFLSVDQSNENVEESQRNQATNQDDSIISHESTFIKKETVTNTLVTPTNTKDENLNNYITEFLNQVDSSNHTKNYKELAHGLSSILASMNRCTELLNSIGSENESIDPSLVDLLSNVNMKVNTLQNAGFYAILKRSMSQSQK